MSKGRKKGKTVKAKKEENIIFSKLKDDVMTTKELVKETELAYSTVTRHVKNLVAEGRLHIRKHNDENHFSIHKSKLDGIPSRLDQVVNLLRINGDMKTDDVVESLPKYSKTSIKNVIESQPENDIKIYQYPVKNEKYYMLSINKPTQEMLDVNKKVKKLKPTKIKQEKPTFNPDLVKSISVKERQPTLNRGHQKFTKYKDEGFKYGSDALHVISEVLALFQTSENPYLFNFKLRHRIETMPEKYWLEQVSLKSYVKDIDMVELPKTGAIKDVDRRPGSLI